MLDAGTTTLMLSGLPLKLNRSMLLQLLNAEGAGRYDLVHVPYDTIAHRPMSVAIVNFTDYTSANKVHGFFKILQKEAGWSLHVVPAAVQGLAANLAFIVASSSLGFAAMSEPSGPLIFTDGVQVADSIAFAACCIPPALLVEARRLIDVDARSPSFKTAGKRKYGKYRGTHGRSVLTAEAAKLFARAARGAALKAALWRFDEERSVQAEVASLRSALLHKKRVEVALRVGQHWRTRAYVRATSRQVFLHRHEPLRLQGA
ncbi:unnamed protein product [Symbiodinium necroappetens]|uniref:RRM domain-containing protein n=1 Tax=Symbiodinium necroappetens TaxID=1628268 RepID=A0A812TXJ6_9DINO|nr:unnamed protein product [Symbiodinium necroappetens]